MIFTSTRLALDSPILLKLAVALVIILIVGWLTLVITMGYQLFRRTSSRFDFDPDDPIIGMAPPERERPEEAEKVRDNLMARPHVSHTIEKDGIRLFALYFPAFTHSDQQENVNETAGEQLHSPAITRIDQQVTVNITESGHVLPITLLDHEDISREERCCNPFDGVCVLIAHGWRDHVLSRARDALHYLDAGFSVLMPALRGHGQTGGTYSDLFLKHYDDLITWMEYVTETYEEEKSERVRSFVLDGVSMGASNVLKTAGDPNLPDSVVAAVADCGYTSLREEGRWMLHKLPVFLRFPVLAVTQVFYGVLAGVWGEKPTPLDHVRHTRIPIFIIHGGNDRFVPTWMGEKIYEACASEKKELWIVPDATHANSSVFAGSDYTRKRHQFIEEALRIFRQSSAQ